MNTRLAGLGAAALVLVLAAMTFWLLSAEPENAGPPESFPIPPVPPRIADGADYARCLDMLAADPAGAANFADAWIARLDETARQRSPELVWTAAHCRALATVGLGQADEGAGALYDLGRTIPAPPVARAILLGQAAQIWLMDGKPSRARDAAEAATALSPGDAGLIVEHAEALLALGAREQAIAELGRALAADPRRADALMLRARALRQGGGKAGLTPSALARALSDIERAASLEPENADVLLERGILRQLSGNSAGAQADWKLALDLAPDGRSADLARQNLALLEAGPDRR